MKWDAEVFISYARGLEICFSPSVFHITVVLVLHICCNYTTLGASEELELLMYTFLGATGGGDEGGLKKY